ncbi:DMT family transporter [Oceaniradius stylonematis]|uniref:DMT family transporter n=1 Tax=Oceaniradius stylonematis TaxID=2184161 RepID=UPI00273FF1FE|nr:DMT family transporter [Oceaniradius stylonematis]
MRAQPNSSKTGVMLAGICLVILGVMPIIANSRPGGFSALSFAFFLSVWQLVFSLPLLLRGIASPDRGIFGAAVDPATRRRTLTVLVSTGIIFGLSTYAYVLAVEKAGAVSAAIAIVSYPLFAILWETLFLGRRKSVFELGLTGLLVIALFYLATGGTWRIDGFSVWFLFALSVPFLWSVAHVIIKEMLGRTPITPAQITFIRVLVSSVFLGIVVLATTDMRTVLDDLANLPFQAFALAMGLVYYVELILWFHAVRTIDVSLASSITVPWPALTMVLAIVFLGEPVAIYQVAAFTIVAVSIYGLILADARKRPVPA